MKNFKMELNEKGILLIGVIILTLTFALGWVCSKGGGSITLTTNDVNAINKAIEVYGDDITITKSYDGNLRINLGSGIKLN